MNTTIVAFHDQAVELRFPEVLEAQIEFLFGLSSPRNVRTTRTFSVRDDNDDRYSIIENGNVIAASLAIADLADFLLEKVTGALIEKLDDAVALHAASVAWNKNAVLIAGSTCSGKTSLAACLIDHGFSLLSDELTLLQDDGTLEGFPRPLLAKAGFGEIVALLTRGGARQAVRTTSYFAIRCNEELASASATPSPALIIFPHYVPGAPLEMTRMSSAKAGLKLMESNLNARNLADHGLHALTELARTVPAIALTYGGFRQLHRVGDFLTKFSVRPTQLEKHISGIGGPFRPEARIYVEPLQAAPIAEAPKPERTAGAPKLTIGMATFDDYDGVYFTIQAIRMYHPEILDQVEILIVDNNPEGPAAKGLEDLKNWIPNYRYVPRTAISGTAVRDYVFREADGEFVLCMDCHVLVVPGALRQLLDYFDANPATCDLVQGPLIYDDLKSYSTNFKHGWQSGMYGMWEANPLGADSSMPPFEIPMQGLGLFACRRQAWPGFNPAFRGFGGEEGYIHEKFRQRGARTLCLPFLRWMHRFHRPRGASYVNVWEDRVWNYMIGFRELGLDTQQIIDHFKELLNEREWAKVVERLGVEFLNDPKDGGRLEKHSSSEPLSAGPEQARSKSLPWSADKAQDWLKPASLPFGSNR